MALFSDSLLSGSSEGELQQKVDEQGGIMPSTPAGALSMGASPDAAKMIGTPAQKQAANFSTSLTKFRAEQDTAQAERARAEADPASKLLRERAQKVLPAAAFAAQFPKLAVQYALSAATDAGTLLGLSVDQGVFSGSTQHLSEAQRTGLQAGLRDLIAAKDPDSREAAIANIAKYWGSIPDSATLSNWFTGRDKEEIRRIFAQGTEDIGDITIGKVLVHHAKDPATMKALLGFSSIEELSDALGMDVEDVAGLTMDSLKGRLREIGADFDTIGELKDKLTSTSTGEFERQAALQKLREIGLVGTLTSVEKLNDIDAQIEDGDTVTFDGEEISVEEILSDDWLMSTVTDALDDPLAMDRLEQLSPEFAKWVEDNRAGLEAKQMDLGLARSEVVETNKEISKLDQIEGTDLLIPKGIMEKLIPGWGSTTFTSIPEMTHPIYTALTSDDYSIEGKAAIVNEMEWLRTAYPNRFNALFEDPLAVALQLPLMAADPAEYKDDVESFEKFQVEQETWKTEDDVMKAIFGSEWKLVMEQLATQKLYIEGIRKPTAVSINSKITEFKYDFVKQFKASGNKIDFSKSPSDMKSAFSDKISAMNADYTITMKRDAASELAKANVADTTSTSVTPGTPGTPTPSTAAPAGSTPAPSSDNPSTVKGGLQTSYTDPPESTTKFTPGTGTVVGVDRNGAPRVIAPPDSAADADPVMTSVENALYSATFTNEQITNPDFIKKMNQYAQGLITIEMEPARIKLAAVWDKLPSMIKSLLSEQAIKAARSIGAPAEILSNYRAYGYNPADNSLLYRSADGQLASRTIAELLTPAPAPTPSPVKAPSTPVITGTTGSSAILKAPAGFTPDQVDVWNGLQSTDKNVSYKAWNTLLGLKDKNSRIANLYKQVLSEFPKYKSTKYILSLATDYAAPPQVKADFAYAKLNQLGLSYLGGISRFYGVGDLQTKLVKAGAPSKTAYFIARAIVDAGITTLGGTYSYNTLKALQKYYDTAIKSGTSDLAKQIKASLFNGNWG